MAKTKKLRKEKYIKQKTVNGRLYLQVSFLYEDDFGFKQSYSKSFRADDYESPAAALDAACAHRDQMRTQLLHSGQKIHARADRKHTVDEAFMLIPADISKDFENSQAPHNNLSQLHPAGGRQ